MMFIHRDDSEPASKGTADLIVAKHRNGPTDTVKLTFLPQLTQFKNSRGHRGGVTGGPRRIGPPSGIRRLRYFGPLDPPRDSDPLDELLLTVLSQNTSDVNRDRAFGRSGSGSRRGTRSPPATAALAAAIKPGGLSNVKAPRIKAILREIEERQGSLRPFLDARRERRGDHRVPLVASRRRTQDGRRSCSRSRSIARRSRSTRTSTASRRGSVSCRRPRPNARSGCSRTRCPTSVDPAPRRADPARTGDLQGAPDARARTARSSNCARPLPVRPRPAPDASSSGAFGERSPRPRWKSEPRRGEGTSTFRARAVERARGIEPPSQAWEACVLPLNHARATGTATGPAKSSEPDLGSHRT